MGKIKRGLKYLTFLGLIYAVILKGFEMPVLSNWVAFTYCLFSFLYLFRNRIRVRKPKTKEWFTLNEFVHQWGEGIKTSTPHQQASVAQYGYFISAFGMLWGIVFAIRIKYYFMIAILIGGLVLLAVQFLANWQRKQIFKKMEDVYNEAEVSRDGF